MIITFDPVANELELDPGNGLPPLVIKADKLFFHLHSVGGHLGCEAEGKRIEVFFEAVDGEPAVPVLVHIAPGHWRLDFLGIDLD